MYQINADDDHPIFKYDTVEERNLHIKKMCTSGYVMTHCCGDIDNLTAQFKYNKENED